MDASVGHNISWNAAVRTTIAKLLRDGLSASQIAETLPFSVSRNAIIGLVHRDMKLRAIGFKNRPPPRRPKQPEPKPEPMPKPVPPSKPTQAASQGSRHDPIERDSPTPPTPPPEPVREGVPLVQIRDGLCRFPLWDQDGAPDFLMCGAATKEGQSYCEGHRARTATARAA